MTVCALISAPAIAAAGDSKATSKRGGDDMAPLDVALASTAETAGSALVSDFEAFCRERFARFL